jgi:hypothetical protein
VRSLDCNALERVALAESESGPRYRTEIVRNGDGTVEVRRRLDLGVARYGARDHLRDMWREQQTNAMSSLILALLMIAQKGGAEAAAASRFASWLVQVTPGLEHADAASISGGIACAIFGGRIGGI